ncbi:MAG: hypothetical protein WD404_04040 [Solirubrobacterales bacterium]
MSSRLARRWLALGGAAALLASGLAACGDDDDQATTASDAAARSDGPGAPEGGKGGDGANEGDGGAAQGRKAGGQGGGDGGATGVDLRVRPGSVEGARVTATGAVQTLPPSEQSHRTAQKNTYGSIRDFGAEAEGEEATNITFGLVQYLDAKARGDWATACARIYSVLRENLEDTEKGRSCAETFGTLMQRVPKANRVEQARIDVSSVRRGSGNRAFVIYKTPDTLSVDMPMYVEDGVWKVAALEAYALTPDRVG